MCDNAIFITVTLEYTIHKKIKRKRKWYVITQKPKAEEQKETFAKMISVIVKGKFRKELNIS